MEGDFDPSEVVCAINACGTSAARILKGITRSQHCHNRRLTTSMKIHCINFCREVAVCFSQESSLESGNSRLLASPFESPIFAAGVQTAFAVLTLGK
jgi:hypothetical protein